MFRSLFAALQQLKVPFLFEPTKRFFLLRLRTKESAEFVVTVARESELFVFSAPVLEAERIPSGAVGQLSHMLLSKHPIGRCHYCFDERGNVVIRLVTSVFSAKKNVLLRIINEIRSEVSDFPRKVLAECPLVKGKRVLFPARLQPPHKGHFDTILMLLERNERVLLDPSDKEQMQLLGEIEKLLISLGPKARERENPLTTHERKELVKFEITNNPELSKHQYRVDLVDSPAGEGRYWLLALLSQIGTVDAVATANTATIQSASDLKIPVLHIHREGGISGTKMRQLCVDQQWEELKLELTPWVFQRCEELELFKVIANIEGSK